MTRVEKLFSKIFFRKKAVHTGVIEESFFSYVTPKLLIMLLLLMGAAFSAIDILIVYFNTNVALNGLIISLIFFATFGIFYNKFLLYSTAHYLLRIEDVVAKEEASEQDVDDLKQTLSRQGKLLNTRNMHDALSNISLYQHPNFTDVDARVIQSKLGNRISFRHAGVGFFAGVLVMLGLLGTFMGLLKTIDAVGGALNNMANMGADGGELGMAEMSAFIGSLSAPLQGMGLAFSSSLFGLSGSLIISVLNKMGMDVQDEFIENVSRWIDNRILTPKGAVKSAEGGATASAEGMGGAEHNDFQAWLSGFIYLSNKTNKRLSKLSLLLYKTHDTQTGVYEACREIAAHQKESKESLKTMVSGVESIKDNTEYVKETVTDMATTVHEVQDKQARSVELQEESTGVRQKIAETLEENTGQLEVLVETGKEDAVVNRSIADSLAVHTQRLKDLVEVVEESAEFSYEHKKLFLDVVEKATERQVATMDKNAEMLSGLLADMIEDLNDKVETNVIDFIKEKQKVDNVEDGLRHILDSQDRMQEEMSALILDMNQRGGDLDAEDAEDSDGDDGTSGGRKGLVRRFFSNDN